MLCKCHYTIKSSLIFYEAMMSLFLPILFKNTKSTFFLVSRNLSLSTQNCHKVSVLGAAGVIGQPLSLLLKQNPSISQLSLYDLAHTYGVVADLSHINTSAKVTGYEGDKELEECLTGSKVVIVPAGVPRKLGMTRNDLFTTNATVLAELSKACAQYCPSSFICIISNLVNSMVPLSSKILNRCGVEDARNVFGITTLDIVRANAFVADEQNVDVRDCDVPVIGGQAGTTIIPLLSRAVPALRSDFKQLKLITKKIQNAETKVVQAKAGKGSATLSMAYAGARFTNSLLKAINGEKDIVECAYVKSNEALSSFFSTPLLLGPNGIEKNLGLGSISNFERALVDASLPDLNKSIQKGVEFAENYHV